MAIPFRVIHPVPRRAHIVQREDRRDRAPEGGVDQRPAPLRPRGTTHLFGFQVLPFFFRRACGHPPSHGRVAKWNISGDARELASFFSCITAKPRVELHRSYEPQIRASDGGVDQRPAPLRPRGTFFFFFFRRAYRHPLSHGRVAKWNISGDARELASFFSYCQA